MKTLAWCVLNLSGEPILATITSTAEESKAFWCRLSCCGWAEWEVRGIKCVQIVISLA